MEISINGKPADITLETEKTVGDVLGGLEQWLTGTDIRLSGLSIDGLETNAAGIAQAMERGLEGIKTIDIRISSWDELAMEALANLMDSCAEYGNASFDMRPLVSKRWEESAAAAFLSAEIPDLHEFSCRSFNGEGLSPEDLALAAEERFRELADPGHEIHNLEEKVSGIAARMEEFPLDIQTGKDGRAAETIQLFSRIGEKIFRLLQVLQKQGFLMDLVRIEEQPINGFLNDFGTALGELTAAYGSQDAVLAGDLAEYELAPRLLKLYSALRDFCQNNIAQNNLSPGDKVLDEARTGS